MQKPLYMTFGERSFDLFISRYHKTGLVGQRKGMYGLDSCPFFDEIGKIIYCIYFLTKTAGENFLLHGLNYGRTVGA